MSPARKTLTQSMGRKTGGTTLGGTMKGPVGKEGKKGITEQIRKDRERRRRKQIVD